MVKQRTLSKKEIKELNKEILKIYAMENFFDKSNSVFSVDDEYIFCDGLAVFFYWEDRLVPTLHLLLKHNFLKKLEVNMGAVPFMAKGADLMRPGIIGVDAGVSPGDIVAIVDENHNKPIAIGESLFSKEEIMGMEGGKIVMNIHHVGDNVWNFQK